jgi:streptomycin 6-kinase
VNDWNVLRILDGTDHKLIDPDGLVADPEYDLGVIMREDPLDLMVEADPMDRARRLADWAQQHAAVPLDPVKIWEWGVVERVSTGLMAIEIDLQPIGSQMLEAADQLSADWPGD